MYIFLMQHMSISLCFVDRLALSSYQTLWLCLWVGSQKSSRDGWPGVIKWHPLWWDETLQMQRKGRLVLRDFPDKNSAWSLDWCHIMTPGVRESSPFSISAELVKHCIPDNLFGWYSSRTTWHFGNLVSQESEICCLFCTKMNVICILEKLSRDNFYRFPSEMSFSDLTSLKKMISQLVAW